MRFSTSTLGANYHFQPKSVVDPNHLGNVLTVVSDKKIATSLAGTPTIVDHYDADIISSTDYYAFGAPMPGRQFNSNSYKYGYQGSEKDNEISGEGNSYTTHYRGIDPRLGRWLSIDPKSTAWESPYVSMGNSPIMYNDPMGDRVHFANFKTFLKVMGAALVDRDIRQRLLQQHKDRREREYTLVDKDGNERYSKTISIKQHYHYSFNPNTESTLTDAIDKTSADRTKKENDGKLITDNRFEASFNVTMVRYKLGS